MEWDDDNQGVYTAEVEVVAIDRPRLTMDVMAVVAEAKIPINSIFSRAVRKTKLATIKLKVEIRIQNICRLLCSVYHRSGM